MLDYPVRHVLVRHEQGAAHMADGYARASGKVGVAIATSGPGATNLVTGIATAMLDSIPTVFITGQVPSHLLGSDAFQETDVTGITLPITKHNALVTDADGLARDDARGLRRSRAAAGPGPCWWTSARTRSRRRPSSMWPESVELPGLQARPQPPAAEDLERAAELIARAERPLILAGHGRAAVRRDRRRCRPSPRRTDTPVALTLLGLGGFPASHPLCLGMMGMHGEAYVNTAIQEADLLLAFGMRFDDRVTGNLKTYAPAREEDPRRDRRSEIGKNVPVDVALVADLRATLEALLADRAREAPRSLARGDRRGPRGDPRPRHHPSARQRQPVRRPRHPRPVGRRPRATRSSSPTSASTRCGRRSTTRTSGRAP